MTSRVLENDWLTDPDVQLMLRIREGDESAFAELVDRYQDRLIGIFYHLFGEHSTAEDLAQEVFLRIHRARATYEPRARFSTWLYRIAHNIASNQRRGRKRRREVNFAGTLSDQSGSFRAEDLLMEKSGLMPTRQVASSEAQEVVRGALNDLSERQRLAVLLHRFEGLSYADIGQVMGIESTAVKSLLSRARENLRESLSRYVRQESVQ